MSEENKTAEEEPVRYDRNLAYGYNEIDTYVGYDIETEVYYDVFGKTITEAEADARRELETNRRAERSAEKQQILEEKQRLAEWLREQSELADMGKELV